LRYCNYLQIYIKIIKFRPSKLVSIYRIGTFLVRTNIMYRFKWNFWNVSETRVRFKTRILRHNWHLQTGRYYVLLNMYVHWCCEMRVDFRAQRRRTFARTRRKYIKSVGERHRLPSVWIFVRVKDAFVHCVRHINTIKSIR